MAASHSATNPNQIIEVSNSTKQPFLIDRNNIHSLKLTQAPTLDSNQPVPSIHPYQQYTPSTPTPLSDADTINLIIFSQI